MKKFSPFLLVIVVLILALAALGVGYGYWTETLDINGTVATGNLDVELASPGGTCDSTPTLGTGNNSLDIDISNAYPGYSCTVTFDVKNTGSIAADFTSAVSTAASPGNVVIATGCSANDLATAGTVSCSATYSLDSSLNETTLPENIPVADSFQLQISATQFNAP